MNHASREVMLHELVDEIDEDWGSVVCVAEAICQYYSKFISKEPSMEPPHTGYMWMMKILRGDEKRCMNFFRMDRDSLIGLCHELEKNYGLNDSRRMSILEKVGMFLYVLSLGATNRLAQKRFQHSGETISRNFHEVLRVMLRFSMNLLKPEDPAFTSVPLEILNDERYMPHFKDCIGAIGCTHVSACVKDNPVPFTGRKGVPTQCLMAACGFDMKFTFVVAGWEGTADDEQVFLSTIDKNEFDFPQPPPDKYYLVDAGYPQREGYLGPYKGTRYRLADFQCGGPPQGYKETVNYRHSSLRSCIERAFRAWKVRWKILRAMPAYPFLVQRDIVVTSMALHNYIRKNSVGDPVFTRFDENPNFVPKDYFPDAEGFPPYEKTCQESGTQMDALRDKIACSLMEAANKC